MAVTRRFISDEMMKGLRALAPKRSKHNNIRTIVDGIKFASKREATRYGQLKLLLSANRIRSLRLQVRFPLIVNGIKICTYISDFQYEEYEHGQWSRVVEDSKGQRLRVYLMKKALMKALLGIEIRES